MMWGFDENEELTPEEENARYLQQNPGAEYNLWREWVGVVCDWNHVPHPTFNEWNVLCANFYPGKTPNNSFHELKQMRNSK